jgi:hypothetical protein
MAVAALGLLLAGQILGQELPAPYNALLTYGPLGIFMVLYLLGYIPSRAELLRQIERAERAEAQRDALTEQAAEKTLPLLVEVQRTMVPTLERLTTSVERMADRVDRLERDPNGRR